jgi:glutaredoxin
MRIDYCENNECRLPFQVNEFKTRFSLPFEYGKITCPHCGFASANEKSSVFLTHLLSRHQEQELMMQKGLAC